MKVISSLILSSLIATAVPFVCVAETVTSSVPYSKEMTLADVSEQVYQRLPGKLAETKYGQLEQANRDLGNALFAEPATANLHLFSDAIGSSNGYQEWESSVDLPLWLPGQKQQQQSLSDKFAAELPAYQQALKLQAAGEVRQLIWQVKLAEAEVEQAKQLWETAKKLLNDVDSRVKAGDLASTERLLASSNSLSAHSTLLDAESRLQSQLKLYQLITGLSALPTDIEETAQVNATLPETHPKLALQEQIIQRLQAQVGLAQYDGAINPNLSVGVKRDRGDRQESYTNSIGVGVSLAFNDKAHRQPAIARASAELADAQVEQQTVYRELTSNLLNFQQRLLSTQQQLRLITEQNDTTQHYFKLQQRAFELGEINLVDLLRSQALANENSNQKRLLEVQEKQHLSQLNQAYGIGFTK
ncbi:MAG TPA: TolC family protein [Methylophaga aminisulfidivorans]|uniref:TolC family protein n=1 Tax=Methylophaga aminisulfidivorans TaxID=230105 RepID=A0A7C1ZPW6_9GAMM|nr:TolC family protein [Methylophaga aminisulfidivorans]